MDVNGRDGNDVRRVLSSKLLPERKLHHERRGVVPVADTRGLFSELPRQPLGLFMLLRRCKQCLFTYSTSIVKATSLLGILF